MLQHLKTKRIQKKVKNIVAFKQLKRNKRKAMLVNLTKVGGSNGSFNY